MFDYQSEVLKLLESMESSKWDDPRWHVTQILQEF